ncbi:hypothetical protein PENSPDRAFT_612749, partial [Peniophora sp. CONT]
SIHALLIGIDCYESDELDDLHGAVSGAEAVGEYLRHNLRVPANQIVFLHNGRATRRTIISQIQSFSTLETLRRGDPILIYFAGHGAAIASTSSTYDEIERIIPTIFPYDYTTGGDRASRAISSRNLDALLSELAGVSSYGGKGDNITVIVDCC